MGSWPVILLWHRLFLIWLNLCPRFTCLCQSTQTTNNTKQMNWLLCGMWIRVIPYIEEYNSRSDNLKRPSKWCRAWDILLHLFMYVCVFIYLYLLECLCKFVKCKKTVSLSKNTADILHSIAITWDKATNTINTHTDRFRKFIYEKR